MYREKYIRSIDTAPKNVYNLYSTCIRICNWIHFFEYLLMESCHGSYKLGDSRS